MTEDLVIGDGAEVSPGATVTLNYVGVSCSTGTIFDDSYSRGEPATFPLANLIQGWQDGIPGMKEGRRSGPHVVEGYLGAVAVGDHTAGAGTAPSAVGIAHDGGGGRHPHDEQVRRGEFDGAVHLLG